MERGLGRKLSEDGGELFGGDDGGVGEKFEFLKMVNVVIRRGEELRSLTVRMVRRERLVRAIEASVAMAVAGKQTEGLDAMREDGKRRWMKRKR